MNERTRTALEESIEHWKRMRDAEVPGKEMPFTKDCALCALFYDEECNGCPVAEAGHKGCTGSPYDRAARLWHEWRDDVDNQELREIWQAAADAEIKFLESLK